MTENGQSASRDGGTPPVWAPAAFDRSAVPVTTGPPRSLLRVSVIATVVALPLAWVFVMGGWLVGVILVVTFSEPDRSSVLGMSNGQAGFVLLCGAVGVLAALVVGYVLAYGLLRHPERPRPAGEAAIAMAVPVLVELGFVAVPFLF